MKATEFFSETYVQARARFLAAAEAAGARIATHENPHAKGPQLTPLFTDTAWFGPADAGTVLLNSCGMHGAEGYGGSAAQLAWISEGGPRRLPPDVAMLMVHAVNPYGFAWGLRGTENNVDLNRNFLDHSQPHPDNPLYDELHPLLCPERIDDAAIQKMLAGGARFIERHGQWALEDAISRGQYSHPDGYHFGGQAPEWSNLTMRQIVRDQLSGAHRVGFVDWHSGPAGDGDLIHLCFSDPRSTGFARAASWWGRTALDPNTVDAMWGSKRPTRCGIMFWGIEEQLKPQAEIAGAVIEFRSAQTKGSAAKAMRVPMLERWLRFVGGFDAPEAAGYFEEIRDDYAPRRRSWQENVITNALGCYETTLSGLGQWAREGLRAAD
ncbi:M14 family metallopeptidase [uncultured Parvibaculum sp.]|uniref:M14 family metallopeptidase n=1 Tax=uncultured Parvibaculum sp. TaxID=291828 RepID=UPI0030DBD4C7|tara:strand:- start:25110 stop:26252 length:1143 start_codon:yes stop_codon:yes gene_type:complete